MMTHISWKSILVILLAAGLLCAGGGLLLRTARGADVTRENSVGLD